MDSEILSVLIVDDEPLLREELRGFDWTGSGAVLVGEAANGEKALAFCREYPPHVIITDITMPVMDGLALFRAVKESYPSTQVILLTCHDEFGYAKEALKLGAVDYIMKAGMQPDDLRQALSKAREHIEQQRYFRSSKEEERRWADSVALGRWLHEPEGGAPQAGEALAARLLALPAPVVTLHLHAPGELLFIDRMIHHFLVGLEKSDECGFRFLPVAMGYYLLLPKLPGQTEEEAARQLEALVGRLREDAALYLSFIGAPIHMFGMLSPRKLSAPEQVRRYLLEAADTEACLFYDSESPVLRWPEREPSPVTGEQAAAMERQLNEEAGEKERLAAFLRGPFCQWATQHRFVPQELRQWLIGWHRARQAQGNGSPHGSQTAERTPVSLLKAATLEELISAAVYELETLSFAGSRHRPEIGKAIQYMRAHLSDPLTLDTAAEQAGYSPRYFSRLFYEETGTGFNDYLTQLRIEQAVRLLQETDARVYEIAGQVGIPSYRYFVKLFRERTGMAPTKIKRS